EADRLAAQVAIVDRGRIVASGAPEELKRKLAGDTIHIEVGNGSGVAAQQALERVSDVAAAELDGRELRVRVRDGAAAVPAVLAALEAQGATAVSLTLARPSLDEVYLRHTGRRFDSAHKRQDSNGHKLEVTA